MNAPLTSGQILDGYHLVRFIGRGGFGEVWLCRSESMGDYRALKFIPTTHGDRFDKEYEALLHYRKAASRLRSPYLVPIEHANRTAAGLYYVMPLADGVADVDPTDPAWQPMSLAALVHEQAGQPAWFSSQLVITLIQPVLEALQTLSEAGLVHRDVKPENILAFNGQPCLGDISLLGADASVITRRGTPGYSAPSWYVGGHPDMYGAAATLYTLLTGNSPDMMGRSAFLWPPQGEASLGKADHAEWKRFHDIIRRATDAKVSERFVDFRAMAAALGGKPSVTKKPSGRKGMVISIAMGCLLAVVWVTAGRSGSPSQSAPPPESQPAPHRPSDTTITPPPSSDTPATPPSPTEGKIVEAGGRFESNRQKISDALGVMIAPRSSGQPAHKRFDVSAYGRSSTIIKSFKKRDYAACLEALDAMHAADGVTSPEPETVLFRCWLLNQLIRDDEAQRELDKLGLRQAEPATDRDDFMARLLARLVLWEALGGYKQGVKLVSETLSTVLGKPAGWKPGTLEKLYQLRARMLVLSGEYAAALADEKSAIALPLPCTTAGTMLQSLNFTEAQARQSHLNTMVMQWELLEQEFPGYADYFVNNAKFLEMTGSSQPRPDRRNLRDVE